MGEIFSVFFSSVLLIFPLFHVGHVFSPVCSFFTSLECLSLAFEAEYILINSPTSAIVYTQFIDTWINSLFIHTRFFVADIFIVSYFQAIT